MRIGLDIDDTICNTHIVLMKYAIKYNKENTNKPMIKYNTNNFSEVFGWSKEETYKIFKEYYLQVLREIEPKFNVKEVLTKLRNEGHKIIFITVRDDNECGGLNTAYNKTSDWLKKYNIPFDELHIDIKDKKTFCQENNIDIFMDDSANHCLGVSETGIKTCMAMNDFNLDFYSEKITNIYNMNEFYEKVTSIGISTKM